MADIIKIIKTIPGIDIDSFKKGLNCPRFWMACIKDLHKVDIQNIGTNGLHWEITAHFLLDPLGVTKIPVETSQDLLWKEDEGFNGDGFKWDYWVENSDAITEATGILFFKPSGNDVKIMLQVTKMDLKAGFLDVAGLGKSMIIKRLEQELQKMVKNLIAITTAGEVKPLLLDC